MISGFLAQRIDLVTRRNATIDRDGLQPCEPGQRADLSRDLGGELACGGKHESSWALAMLLEESVEQPQREGRRLAGASLCQTQHIAAGATCRNRLELDWPGILETNGVNAANEGFMELEAIETGRSSRF